MSELATQAGLDSAMPEVFYWLDHEIAGDGDARDEATQTYPWSFPELEDALDPLLTPANLDTNRQTLNDMAGLAVLAAANSGFDAGDDSNAWLGSVAYVLLKALVADKSDCTANLNMATLVSLGQFPTANSIRQTMSAAVAACPGDPTPRWLWVQVASNPTDVEEPSTTSDDRSLEIARAWEKQQPGSALAVASEAERLIHEAEVRHDDQIMPFTVRSDALLALTRYKQAELIEPDPAFVLGEARAQALLGDDTTAATTLTSLTQQAPTNTDLHLLDVTDLERAHRWEDAATEGRRTDQLEAADPSALVPDKGATSSGWVGLSTIGATPVSVLDPTQLELGGGAVDWLGYIPDYRTVFHDASRIAPWCSNTSEVRDLILAGHPGQALTAANTLPPDVDQCQQGRTRDPIAFGDPRFFDDSAPRSQMLRAIAALRVGDRTQLSSALAGDDDASPISVDAVYEEDQNMWRFAGDLNTAWATAEAWVKASGSPQSHDRLGEVDFLRGDFTDSAHEFGIAQKGRTDNDLGVWTDVDATTAALAHGTALEKEGRTNDAAAVYRDLIRSTSPLVASDDEDPGVDLSAAGARARLGLLALGRDDPNEAVRQLTPAAKAVALLEQGHETFRPLDDQLTGGAEDNNLAVALLAEGTSRSGASEALKWAERAFAHDDASPVYADTVALAEQEAGHSPSAIATYRSAVAADPTQFQSWNNLGVLLDQAGQHHEATAAFQQAVAVQDNYALGWFNLGVELGRSWNPFHLADSQRAMAKAVRLDSSFRGRSQSVQADTTAVNTGLDVSRPIPATWTFTDTVTRTAPGLSFMVLLISLWRLLLALGLDQVGGWVAERFLDGHSHRRWAKVWATVNRFTGLAVGLAAALFVCSWPMAHGTGGQKWQLLAVVAALGAALWLYVAAGRWRATRVGGPKRPVYQGWLPGMGFGITAALLGYAFVPVPVNNEPFTDRRVRLVGHRLLVLLTVALLTVAFVTGAPIARLVGIGVLAMLSTVMIPVKPYDGGFLHHRLTATITSVALILVSGVLVLGLA